MLASLNPLAHSCQNITIMNWGFHIIIITIEAFNAAEMVVGYTGSYMQKAGATNYIVYKYMYLINVSYI